MGFLLRIFVLVNTCRLKMKTCLTMLKGKQKGFRKFIYSAWASPVNVVLYFCGCENYRQLISLLKSDLLENLNLILAVLLSKAEDCLLKFLNTDMNNTLSRF